MTNIMYMTAVISVSVVAITAIICMVIYAGRKKA